MSGFVAEQNLALSIDVHGPASQSEPAVRQCTMQPRTNDAETNDSIRPIGPRLTIDNAHKLSEAGKARITSEADRLVIDLVEIDFIDSSGIGVLVNLRKKIPDGDVHLINVGRFVSLVLKKTLTDRLFTISER